MYYNPIGTRTNCVMPVLVINVAPGSDISNMGMTNNKAYIIPLGNTTANVTSTVSNLMSTSIQDGGQI
jgi:hypothetical protein